MLYIGFAVIINEVNIFLFFEILSNPLLACLEIAVQESSFIVQFLATKN